MSEKIVIVGGVAGGASTAARLRRLNEDLEIIVLERGDYVSFANCRLPYYLGKKVEKRQDLIIQTPKKIEAKFDIDVRTENEAVDIDPQNQRVEIRDTQKEKIYHENYDKLILSPGAKPIKPPIEGIDQIKNLFTLKDIPDVDSIKEFIESREVQKAVIVGGGFIGLEMTENLRNIGLDVSLVEMMEQVMPPIDYDMATKIHKHLRENGVELHLKDGVKSFKNDEGRSKVVLESGNEIGADIIILAIGVRPETELAEKAGLEIGETGGIKVDEYLRTSDPHIYAIGDAIEVKNYIDETPAHIPLAGPANKQGRIVANNIAGKKEKYSGTQGTFITKIFDLTVASTGLNEKTVKEKDIDYEKSFTVSSSHAGYYPGAKEMTIKIIFDPENGDLYGAQIVGGDGVDKRIDVLASAIRFNKNVFDLQELELAYAPPYSSAKDPVNMAGYVAGNIINGIMNVVHWDELDSLDENERVILDVRNKPELENGYIKNSIHIPLSELRSRMEEIPKDKKIISYCAIGLRSYIANRILIQNGYEALNLSGGYNVYQSIKEDKKNVNRTPQSN